MNRPVWMQVLATKTREGNCTERYFRGFKNQNGEHLVNICQSKILGSHNRNDENENNAPQNYGRWMHSLMNACSQSLFYQVLDAVSDVF